MSAAAPQSPKWKRLSRREWQPAITSFLESELDLAGATTSSFVSKFKMSTPHQQNTPLQIKATVAYADGRRVTQRWMVSSDPDGLLSFTIFARKKDSETEEMFRAYFTLDETVREDPASSEYVVLRPRKFFSVKVSG
jgi:hypothetical protein